MFKEYETLVLSTLRHNCLDRLSAERCCNRICRCCASHRGSSVPRNARQVSSHQPTRTGRSDYLLSPRQPLRTNSDLHWLDQLQWCFRDLQVALPSSVAHLLSTSSHGKAWPSTCRKDHPVTHSLILSKGSKNTCASTRPGRRCCSRPHATFIQTVVIKD